MPKEQYGAQGQQETDNAGVPKWTVEVAVTFTPTASGMKPISELISVTITDRVQPGQGLNPGAQVAFDGFRVGWNPPEIVPGKPNQPPRIRGGKLWYNAVALRSFAAPSARREQAA